MMTSHLLFVGYSLKDQHFVELAAAVAPLYAQAKKNLDELAKVATVLSLKAGEDMLEHLDGVEALERVTMAADGENHELAARTLQVFLDRASAVASEQRSGSHAYLLDPRYRGLLSAEEANIRDSLLVAAKAASDARQSGAAGKVLECLRSMGLAGSGST